MVRWVRGCRAMGDARKVFRAARDGRPLELEKRLVLGKLGGGLKMLGEVDGEMVGPLEAARRGEHEECIVQLERAMGVGEVDGLTEMIERGQ